MNITVDKKDYLWSYLAYTLKLGGNVIILPIVLRFLSPDEYGLWVTFVTIGVVINLLDFGFSSTILRNIAYVWSGAFHLQRVGITGASRDSLRNDRLFASTFFTCKKIYRVISLICLFISATAGTAYVYYIIRNIFDLKYIIAWCIYGLSISLNFYSGYWGIVLRSIGAVQQSQKAVIISNIAQIVLSYIGLKMNLGVVALAFSACVCGVIMRSIARYYCLRYADVKQILSEYKNIISKEEQVSLFKTLWFGASRAGISSLATVAMTQSTTLISSAYLGVAVTGQIGLCFQVLSALIAIGQIFFQTTLPQLVQSCNHANLCESQRLFSLSLVIAWVTFLSGAVFFAVSGNFILCLIGSQVSFDCWLFTIMALYMFGEMNYSMHAAYISFDNELPFVRSVTITSFMVVFLSIAACRIFSVGIIGLMLIRCLVESAYLFWKWPHYAHEKLKMDSFHTLRYGLTELYRLCKKYIQK